MAKMRHPDLGNTPDVPPRPRGAAEGRDLRNTVRQAIGRTRAVAPTMSRSETTEIMHRARGLLKPA